jgi:quercetin dioxygenase-like cupin family protein
MGTRLRSVALFEPAGVTGVTPRRSKLLPRILAAALVVVLAGCGNPFDDDDSDGDGALGGSARTETLAEEAVETLPGGPLSWIAYEARLAAGDAPVSHQHEMGFVYARDGAHILTLDGTEVELAPGEARFVGRDVEHAHAGEGTFWEIRLAAPDAGLPPGMEGAGAVFASPVLEGIPETPVQLVFVLVELPAGSETSVHTHPGPEYIYVTAGAFDYQNALIGTDPMTVGDDHYVPPDTAVQKRNTSGAPATFLSWFVVDPDRPFAPGASFE